MKVQTDLTVGSTFSNITDEAKVISEETVNFFSDANQEAKSFTKSVTNTINSTWGYFTHIIK
jgi:hypothetical protein